MRIKLCLCNILPGLICTWNDVNEICAKEFLEGTFMCTRQVLLCALVTRPVCVHCSWPSITANALLSASITTTTMKLCQLHSGSGWNLEVVVSDERIGLFLAGMHSMSCWDSGRKSISVSDGRWESRRRLRYSGWWTDVFRISPTMSISFDCSCFSWSK